MKKKALKRGFTLIELSLSLVFIAILSVTVVLLIQNTTASYRRGLILNQVNTTGMDLVDDMRVSIQNASSDNILKMCENFYGTGGNACTNNNANSFIYVVKRGTVQTKVKGAASWNTIGTNMPVYGAICTGSYTYIWNSGYFEGADLEDRQVVSISPVTLSVGTVDSASEILSGFRLLKIYDAERTVCVNAMRVQNDDRGMSYVSSNNYNNGRVPSTFVISQAMLNADPDHESGVELLRRSETSDLVLYDLYTAPPAFSNTRKNFFYAMSFILGTRRGGINIRVAGNSCKPPTDYLSELEYCAINKFNFAVQAGGR